MPQILQQGAQLPKADKVLCMALCAKLAKYSAYSSRRTTNC